MDNIKAIAHQFSRVTPSQSGEKQRYEGFISAQADSSKSKREEVKNVAANHHAQFNQSSEITDRRTNALLEQRKQDMAAQLSEKDKARDRTDKQEELSAQRQLETRAAANKQKIKSSYSAVQSHNQQGKPDLHKAEQVAESQTKKSSNPEPINLVV